MNSNEKNINSVSLDKDIENLSRSIYLESPDLWIEFSDKMSDNIFDEMVVFFATKYNYINIIKHAVKNNLIDLDSPSRNKAYSSIRDHLIIAAKQNNHNDIYNYLNNLDDIDDVENLPLDNTENLPSSDFTADNDENYIPKFICPECNSNVFDSGYIISKNITYKFSTKEKKIIDVSNELCDSVVCCSCNNNLNKITPIILENLSTVQSCRKCGLDLTQIGIIDKAKMIYDKNTNRFTSTSTSYHCSNCDNLIDKYQEEYFRL